METAVGLRAGTIKKKRPEKWHYKVVPEYFYREDLGEFHTYGIQWETPNCTGIMHDVSVCKKTTECIVELLNRYQVSHIHLYDVVMDLL